MAIAEDGTLYLASSPSSASGLLIALSPEGQRLWTVPFDGELIKAPVIGSDGTVHIGSGDRAFFAYDSNGTNKWKYAVGANITSSPAIGEGGEIYFGASDGLHAISSQGQLLWSFASAGQVSSSPAIGEEGTVYFGTEGGLFFALTSEGIEKWRFAATGGIHSSPAIGADGSIYFGSRGGKGTDAQGVFYALNPDGKVRWVVNMSEYRRPGSGGSPNYVDASPVISPDGILYFCAVDAQLYAVEIGIPLASSPWPMYGHDRFHTFRTQPGGPVFRAPQFDRSKGFQTTLTGLSSHPTTLWYSTNLVRWEILTNLPAGGATVTVRDPNPGQSPMRFYRAVEE